MNTDMNAKQPEPAGRLVYPPATKHVQGRKPVPEPEIAVEPTASRAIDSFAKPKLGFAKLVIFTVISAVLVGLLAVFINTQRVIPESSASSNPTPTSEKPGLPFVDRTSKAEGRWRILKTQWTATGVNIQVEVACDKGAGSYSFRAFSNSQNMSVVEPTGNGPDPVLTRGRLAAGDSAVGWVQFEVPRADFTLVLTDYFDRQISALEVKS